jgi:hypothetical protein
VLIGAASYRWQALKTKCKLSARKTYMQFQRSFVVTSSIFNHLQPIIVSDWQQTTWLHRFNPQWGSTLRCTGNFCCNLVREFSVVVQAGLDPSRSTSDFSRTYPPDLTVTVVTFFVQDLCQNIICLRHWCSLWLSIIFCSEQPLDHKTFATQQLSWR